MKTILWAKVSLNFKEYLVGSIFGKDHIDRWHL